MYPDIYVHVAPDSLLCRDRSITGVIHLRVRDESFPCEGWSDFPVVVLYWWMRELGWDAAVGRRCIRCQFMDGPQYFEILPSPGQWEIRTFDPGHPPRSWWLQDDGAQFLDSLRQASVKVVAVCREKGWVTSDVEQLASMI